MWWNKKRKMTSNSYHSYFKFANKVLGLLDFRFSQASAVLFLLNFWKFTIFAVCDSWFAQILDFRSSSSSQDSKALLPTESEIKRQVSTKTEAPVILKANGHLPEISFELARTLATKLAARLKLNLSFETSKLSRAEEKYKITRRVKWRSETLE